MFYVTKLVIYYEKEVCYNLILLLSFVFVSCVTANTGKRDLSGVNIKPELSSIDNQFKTCVSDCTAKGGLSFWCSDSCLETAKIKQKKPLKLADYATCMWACQRDGGSEGECHEACRREE